MSSMFERPTHPDMAVIIELINKLDDRAGREQSIDGLLDDLSVDKRSLGYLATQRAMRALGITTLSEVKWVIHDFTRLASVYHEAFIMGVWWQEREGK